MAISPKTRYPGQTTTSDPTGYPEGKAQDVTVQGDGTGTPWQEDLTNDIFGFQQELLARASISPSGTPDKAGASQYVEGVEAVATDIVAPTEAVVRSDLVGSRGVFASALQACPAWEPTLARPHWEKDSTADAAWDVMRAHASTGNLSWGFSAGSNLPFQVTITEVRCWVKQAAAYVLGDRMKMRISIRDAGTFVSAVNSTTEAAAGTAIQSIVKSGLSIPLVATDTGVFPGGVPLDMTVTLFAGVGTPPLNDLAYFCEVRHTLAIL